MAYPPTAGMVAQRCLLDLPMGGRWVPEAELALAPLRCWQPCLRVAGHMAYPPKAGVVALCILLHLPMAGRWAPEPELVLAPLRCWQPCLRAAGHWVLALLPCS